MNEETVQYIIEAMKSIQHIADTITLGNVTHHRMTLKYIAQSILDMMRNRELV